MDAAWVVAAWWYVGWLVVTYAAGIANGWWLGKGTTVSVAVQQALRDAADTIPNDLPMHCHPESAASWLRDRADAIQPHRHRG